jgi:DNA-binding beta-propeller fold protein YncE/cytochrome c peroxidase
MTIPASAFSAPVLSACVLAFLTVFASAPPASPVIHGATAAPAMAYVGEEVRFSVEATDTEGLPLTYRWRFGDSTAAGPYGRSKEASHAYGVPGHYRASIYVRNETGELANLFLPVTVLTRPTAVQPTHSSSIVLDTVRGRVWCVNPDNGSVSAVDAGLESLLFEIPTGVSPQSLALDRDGNVWVVNRGSATLSVLSGSDGRALATISLPYGSRPHGIAFNPAGTAAYVSLEGSGRLIRLDPLARSVVGEIDVGPTPRALAVSGDGKRILVTRFISPAMHAEVYEVSADGFAKVRTFVLALDTAPDTETGGGGVLNYLASIVISPDGRTAAVSAAKANTRRGRFLSGVDLIAENTVRTALAFLDLEANGESASPRNDFDNAALASASVYSRAGDLIFTSLEGSNAVHTRDPYNSGAVLERNKAAGLAPIGLALDPRAKTLYVHAFLGRSISAWDVSPYNDPGAIEKDSVQSRPRGSISTISHDALDPLVLKGKRVFYNAADPLMSFNGYISCAVCHLDGGTDGRVWDFTDRGEGLRRTASLLGRAGMGHGPVHWSANFDEIQDFENDIRGPFGGKGFMSDADFLAGARSRTLGDAKAGLSPDLDALAAYVNSLVQVNPSPYRNADGSKTSEAAAGEAIFNSARAGCARCHVPPLYTDSRLAGPAAKGSSAFTGAASTGLLPGDFITPQGFLVHDVGTLAPSAGKRMGDTLLGIDTPTLKGIWETGPYLHDGSAATLMDVITTANAGDRHGTTSHLTATQKDQLVAFLRQLDDGPPAKVGIAGRGSPGGTHRLRVDRVGSGFRIGLAGFGPSARVRLLDARGRTLWVSGGRIGSARGASAGGDRVVIWDGRDARGGRLPAGVYRMVAEDGAGKAVAALPWMP